MTFKTVLLGATAAMGLATGAMAQDDKTKVGFIYVGPIGDLGWSYQHDQGRLAVEEEFGDRVETVYVESVPEGPDAERPRDGAAPALTAASKSALKTPARHRLRPHGPRRPNNSGHGTICS